MSRQYLKLAAFLALGSLETGTAAIPEIQQIRVKIFPHLGTYSAPQKSERDLSAVQLYSRSKCKRMTLDSETQKSHQESIPPRTQIRLTAEEIQNKTVTVQCEGAVNLYRGEGLDIFFYEGKIEAKIIQGQLTLINTVSLEDYVKGVLPAEMPRTWHIEALRAQAIAARTYAVHQIEQIRSKKADRSFDVDDTVQYQAYLGKSWQTEKTNQAVDSTRGIILTYNHQPIRAYFSADSGCHTESAKNIWGDRYDVPYTPSKPEFYDSKVKSDWSYSIPLKKIELRTIQHLGLSPQYCLKDVLISRKSDSGRANQITLVPCLSENKVRILSAEIFRQYMSLPSTLFEIQTSVQSPDALTFDGKGSGHGVGLNQTGANALATNQGWDHYRILNYYFDGIQFESAR